jgi:hypothetical protein
VGDHDTSARITIELLEAAAAAERLRDSLQNYLKRRVSADDLDQLKDAVRTLDIISNKIVSLARQLQPPWFEEGPSD